jgi:four helix bundle protein
VLLLDRYSCKSRRRGTNVAFAMSMTVTRYQDLVAWQLANELKINVYELVATTRASSDREFSNQLRRAASSVPANLAEAFGAYNHPEAARYARIARSSLIETHNHIGDGADRGFWTREAATEHQALVDRATAATTKWLEYLTTTHAPTPWPKRKA